MLLIKNILKIGTPDILTPRLLKSLLVSFTVDLPSIWWT